MTMLLIALLAMTGVQCNQSATTEPTGVADDQGKTPQQPDIVRLSEKAQDLAGIEIARVENRACRSILAARGKVLAPQQQTAIISHAFSARVSQLHVKVGDTVGQGDPLVTLECHEVGEAKSAFFKTIADLELAKETLAREKQLEADGIGIGKNRLAAEAAHTIAVHAREAAEKSLHVLGFTEDDVAEMIETHQIHPSITLSSPIAGKVVTSKAVLGALVDQLTEILTVIDLQTLWVDAQVFEKDLERVRVGQGVDVVVTAYPEKTFRGQVTYIGDVVDEATRTITVRAEVDNGEMLLKPGMFAKVDVLLNGGCEMLVVPEAAVLEERGRKFVFLKEKDYFRRRFVEVGDREGDDRQIEQGLLVDQEVVTQGNYELYSELKQEILHQGHGHQH